MTQRTASQSFTRDWALHPGEVLRTELADRGMTQAELALRTGLSAKHVNQLTKKAIGVSPDIALRLERALNLPALFWTDLEAKYGAYVARQNAIADQPALGAWARTFDYSTLVRAGIADPSADSLGEGLLRFFGVASVAAFDATWMRPRVSFRRSQSFTVAEHNTALWLAMVDRYAVPSSPTAFSLAKLRRTVRLLPRLTTLPIVDGIIAARHALSAAGVTLAFLRQVPGTRISGATWWTEAEQPVIAFTERQRFEDSLWFSIFHELGHLTRHPNRQVFLDIDADKLVDDEAEAEADDFAEESLFPNGGRERIGAAHSRAQLAVLATEFGISAGIVAGCHGFLTKQWKVGSHLRRSVTHDQIDELEAISIQLPGKLP